MAWYVRQLLKLFRGDQVNEPEIITVNMAVDILSEPETITANMDILRYTEI